MQQRTHELSESNETKNKLFAILAHDLRGPLTSLSGLARKVEFLTRKNRISELQSFAEQTESKIDVLSESLDNILNWALVEMGKIELNVEKVFFVKVIEEITTLYRTQILSKRLKLIIEVEKKEYVYSDRRVLHIILRNIINNAIKFSSENQKIRITISSRNNDYVTIEIIDSGLGLNPTEAELGHYNSLNNTKSSGIGLIIIRELAELLHIDFKLIPNELNGATAVLAIPCKSGFDHS